MKNFLIEEEFLLKNHQLINRLTDEKIKLEPLLHQIILYLITNNDQVVTREELQNKFWNSDIYADEALTKAISKLRAVLNEDSGNPKYIRTYKKVGYQWIGKIMTEEIKDNQPVHPESSIYKLIYDRKFYYTASIILLVLMMLRSMIFPHH
ncbi:MAG: helix-turn-helix domain-containing protein [Marinoscillum sp.]